MKISRVMQYTINDVQIGDIIALNVWQYHEYIIIIGEVIKIEGNYIRIKDNNSNEYQENVRHIDIEKTIELNNNKDNYINKLETIENTLNETIKLINLELNDLKSYFSLKGKYGYERKINEIRDYLKITSLDNVITKIKQVCSYLRTY
jgi:hypothetical protein